MREIKVVRIEQIFSARGGSDSVGSSYDNLKGNAETERMMRTIKEEILWLHEFFFSRGGQERG